MKGLADKMTDHQGLTAMGLQALPVKRTIEGLELTGGSRPAKQQCTIRVGCEAPDYLTSFTNDNTSTASWYRETTDYETYSNGFNAAEVRTSTPFNSPAYYNNAAEVPNPTLDFNNSFSSMNNETYNTCSSSPVYQNLSSLPVQNNEVLSDRFERVCSSPRPYVHYNGCSREESLASYASYSNSNSPAEPPRDDRYWTFGYNGQCPKRSPSSPSNYAKSNGFAGPYNDSMFKSVNNGYSSPIYGQNIQRDENGKSYLELGAKAAPEWRPTPWPNSYPVPLKTCSKCGHVINRSPQPCYRHQRLSVLSISMLKLNRYRQCSDPSLHRSVLICNTLRHIEDEMEREGLSCNIAAETSSSSSSLSSSPAPNNCDTCCCSQCGTGFNGSYGTSTNFTKTENSQVPPTFDSPLQNFESSNKNGTFAASSTPVIVSADEEDSGFGDDDSRDIDWSSVFSMSSTMSEFEVSSASHVSDSYLCDSSSSDPSIFSGSDCSSELSELNPSWKVTSWTSEPDFGGVRWKSDLGDELEGFVHILVGS